MKKSIAVILAMITIFSMTFVACKGDKTDDKNGSTAPSSENGIADSGDEFVIEDEEVTDADGKKVTDKNGKPVTTQKTYRIEKDKNGNPYKVEIGDDGEDVTDKNGNKVTSPYSTTKPKKTTTDAAPTTQSTKPTNVPTSQVENADPTNAQLTTISSDKDKVPALSATGKKVEFSQDDANIVAEMLMVPYLYNDNYENKNGVPTNIAAHVAMWMAAREGLNTSVYASGTIVLDLFKYFGQTVVNFKTKCNSEPSKDYNLSYSSSKDTFTITEFEKQTHTVKDLKFTYLGNNNYYKVEGKVEGCKYTKVTAIVQKNKLDATLGFSIKALKWS